MRTVPSRIALPDYAHTGRPSDRRSRAVRTPEEIPKMRLAGQLAAEVLIEVGEAIAPGVTTDELDRVGHEAAIARDSYPSPLNYRGFPKSLCTSVNEVVCHGIPDSRKLEEGDIVNVDVTVFHDGVHGDTNCTFLVGEVDPASRYLIEATYAATYAGIGAVRPGALVNHIGLAIERSVDQSRYGIVEEFIGHGIGDQFHTSLQIPHYYSRQATTKIEAGMTFTVEPMITIGPADVRIWDDDWTAVTESFQRTAQFEHTLLVTEDGAEILTVTAEGRCAADRYAPAEATA
jgi:methionyl aminopeptidase